MANIYPKAGDVPPWEDVSSFGRTITTLTRAYGNHPLAFFGLAPEHEHFLAPDGKGLVNYQRINHTAVVLGDPLCSPEAIEQVTHSFLKFCASCRWSVAFYQASSHFLDNTRVLNLRSLKMGEEAILLPQRFTLQGAALANVRTSCRRAEREGITIQWYEGVLSGAVLQQLASVSHSWLKHKGGELAEETGFSVGRLSDIMTSARRADWVASSSPLSPGSPLIPSLVTGVAMTSAGNACAFLTFTPLYGRTPGNTDTQQGWGWALDLMRRDPDAPPGVMELLLVQALERFRLAGACTVSLGLAALADSKQEITPARRLIADFLVNRIGLFENRQTLFAFKQKFQPVWQSRYLV
ncbi:MAG TPA: DUF2156 domain-containing protein, partial [Ktedonobacteraceae bacterium]